MLNRSSIIVRPKQPYIDWAAGLDDVGLLPTGDDERTVYLIQDYADDKEAESILKKAWDSIFESELENWHLVEDDWPDNRTYKMFREWFDVEMHSMVIDLCSDPLEDDGY